MPTSRTMTVPNRSSGDVAVYTYSSSNNSTLRYQNFPSAWKIEQMVRNHTIYPRFRFYVLNPDETVRYEIPAADIKTGGSYSENYQSGQRRSLSLTLNNDSGRYTPSVNGFWANTKISFEIGMAFPEDNDSILWFSKGIYVLTSISPSHSAESKDISMEFSDKFAVLEGALGVLPSSYEIPVGTNIEEALEDILTYGKGDGDCLDPKPMIYHSSFKGKTTQATIEGSTGDSWGSIVLSLAEQLSAEVFYNTAGNLTLVPKVEVTDDGDKPVLYDLFENEGDFSDNGMSYDMTQIVNRVIVIGANVNGGTCQAIAVNDDASSPLCYQRIGYRTGAPVNDSNITSDVLAQERADYELRQQLIAKTTISNTVLFNPLLTVNNIVTITDSFYGLERERVLLQSISFSIDYSGTMSISSTNIRNLPYTTA